MRNTTTMNVRWLPVGLFLLLWATPGRAQEDFPKGELFGGLSMAKNHTAGLETRGRVNGWMAGFAVNLNPHWGVAVEFSDQFSGGCSAGEVCGEGFFGPVTTESTNFRTSQFLTGPRYTLRTDYVNVFGHALFGIARTRTTFAHTEPDPNQNTSCGFLFCGPLFPPTITVKETVTSGPDFAMGFGGGVDVRRNDSVTYRLLQVDFIPVRTARGWETDLRFQIGLVLTLGRQ